MQELAEAALEASGQAVADALREALDGAPSAALGVVRFLDMAEAPGAEEPCPGCPIAPTALESPIISPRLRAAAARCFDQWKDLIAARLRADGWPEGSVTETASETAKFLAGHRFNTKTLYQALDSQRRLRKLTWLEVAQEIGDDISPPMLTRLAKGGRIGVHVMVLAVQWLGTTIEVFTRA